MNETFKIFQIDVIEAKKIEVSINDPHPHGFEELIIGIEEQLKHFIDFKSTVFDAPFISFVEPDGLPPEVCRYTSNLFC
jgi:AraC family transcriptional regulator, transcriptional activator of pobA